MLNEMVDEQDDTGAPSRPLRRRRSEAERQAQAAQRRLDAELLDRIGAQREHDLPTGAALTESSGRSHTAGTGSFAQRPCPEYEVLANRLFGYAIPVFKSLLRNGAIKKELVARNLPAGLTADDYERLHTSMAARDALAITVVITGEDYFRRTVIPSKKWSAEGGASLETFFVNGCMLHFAASARAWKKEHPEWSSSPAIDALQEPADTTADQRASDLMEAVENRDLINRLAAFAPPMVKTILPLILEGFSFAEIGERVGLSERAVEGRLHRFRTQVKKEARRGHLDLPFGLATQDAA